MRESGYYPPGAEFDPNAPYNEVENPELEFEVLASQTLSKSTSIYTKDYIEEIDADEDGYHRYLNTDNTDWMEAYEKDGHYTPKELIDEFKKFLTQYLPDPIINIREHNRFKKLIEECEGWTEDETEVVKD